jgi:drug/metabolite transporter (DMT)-like permease
MTVLPLPPLRRDSAQGIACLCAGISIFAIQDLILKRLSGDYPLYEAMIFRSLTAIPFLLLLVHFNGGLGTLITPGWRQLVLRGLIMFGAYTCYYLALAALPMATTAALYFSAPLFITLLSVLMLKEQVGLRRWLAVFAGFCGVIIMLRPGSMLFDWARLLAVFSGLCYGLSMVTARSLGNRHSAAALAFYGNAVFLAAASLLALIFGSGAFGHEHHKSLEFFMRGWETPTRYDLMLMMTCGVIAALGLTLLTQAYRIAEANVVAPFEYSALIWSVIYGWIFWRDWPDTTAWIGITVIVGAGLYVLYRERVVQTRTT